MSCIEPSKNNKPAIWVVDLLENFTQNIFSINPVESIFIDWRSQSCVEVWSLSIQFKSWFVDKYLEQAS